MLPAGTNLLGFVDPVTKGTATNRSATIGFLGTSGSATTSSTTLTTATITSAFTNQAGAVSGIPMVGQVITGTGITTGTTITAVSGTGPTYTLTLSAAATVAAGTALGSAGPQQLMPPIATRRGDRIQNQGTGNCWRNGVGAVTTDQNSYLIFPQGTDDSRETFVGTGTVAMLCAVAATPIFAREW